jgi:hypothetical protein
MKSFEHIANKVPPKIFSAEKVGRILFLSWKFLLNIFIFDELSLTAHSPSDDQTNSRPDPKDLFLHAKAV